MFPWNACFEEIELCIESKDWIQAKKLIHDAIAEAEKSLIDPSFLVRQLRAQRNKVEQLEDALR